MRSLFESKKKFRILATINFENPFIKMDCEPSFREKIATLWDDLQFNSLNTAVNEALARVVKTNLPKNEAPFVIEPNQGKSANVAYAFSMALVDSSELVRRVDAVISVDLNVKLSEKEFTDALTASLRGFKSKLEIQLPNEYQGQMFAPEPLAIAAKAKDPIARPDTPTPFL